MLEEITENKDQSLALIACFWSLVNLQAYNSAKYRVGTKRTVTDYARREATGPMLRQCLVLGSWPHPSDPHRPTTEPAQLQKKCFCPVATHVPIPIPHFLVKETLEVNIKGRSY